MFLGVLILSFNFSFLFKEPYSLIFAWFSKILELFREDTLLAYLELKHKP